MITVTLYFLAETPELQQVREHLASLKETHPHQLVQINVSQDTALRPTYEARVPVLQIGPYTLEGNITRERLMVTLGAARDRAAQLEKIDQKAYHDKLA